MATTRSRPTSDAKQQELNQLCDQPAAVGDPASEVTLFNDLATEAERLGYNVSVWCDETFPTTAVEVDHDAATIAVGEDADAPETLTKLASIVAAISATKLKTTEIAIDQPTRTA